MSGRRLPYSGAHGDSRLVPGPGAARRRPPVVGDEVVVLVLDLGVADRLTIFHTEAPIDDVARRDKAMAALESLRRS